MRTLAIIALLPFAKLAAQVPDSLVLRLRSFYSDLLEAAPSSEDSSLFATFRQRMEGEPVLEKPPHPLEEYKLVWAEAREGHRYNLLRGDGRELTGYLSDGHLPGPHYFPALGPTFYGDRFATVGNSPDTGLIRYEFWYYEREVPVKTGQE